MSEAVKVPGTRQTRKNQHPEFQTHGFEADVVGARADRQVLVTVKSFFGSQGVRWQEYHHWLVKEVQAWAQNTQS